MKKLFQSNPASRMAADIKVLEVFPLKEDW